MTGKPFILSIEPSTKNYGTDEGAMGRYQSDLDASRNRISSIKSNPDFTKLLVQVNGNKSKINKIMKTHKAKKIFEGKLTEGGKHAKLIKSLKDELRLVRNTKKYTQKTISDLRKTSDDSWKKGNWEK